MGTKKVRLILMIASCLMIAGGCMRSQSSYYVDPNGDDSRDGKSPATAWRTLARVNSVSYSPGDQVLFKRGGVWHEAMQLTSSGVSGNPIVYADYGTGPKPTIDLGGSLPGWSSSGNWTNRGGNRWSISLGWWPGRMWFDGVEYGCPGFSVGPDGNALTSTYLYTYGSNVTSARYRWWWNSGVLYIYSNGNPSSVYSSIEISQASSGISNSWSGKSYVTFKNLEFKRGNVCIDLNNCDYFTFDSCKILAGTTCYGLFIGDGSDYGVIKNHCQLDREDTVLHQFGYGGGPTLGGGDDNIAIQFGSHWDIGNSYFGGTGHGGVEISGGSPPGCYSNYNKIHDCELYGGSDYCRAFLCQGVNYANPGDSASAWTAQNNEFYRNYIHGMTVVSDIGAIYSKVYYNIFADQGKVWWDDMRPDRAPGDQIWRSTMLTPSAGYPVYHLQVFNNTFYTAQGSAIRIATESGSHGYNSFKNNIIYNTGLLNNWASPYMALEIWPGVSKDTIQNNIIFSPHSTATICLYQQSWGHGWTPRSVAYMEANPGPNVISGNVVMDPKLLPDFRIPLTSPAKDAGINVGLNEDFFGAPVSGAKPDIGACEAPSASGQTEVEEISSSPGMLLLDQNYPNPFNPTTVIRFTVPRESRVLLEVFNILGQCVATLVDAVRPAGMHEARFDGRALASGTYLYRLQTEGHPPLVRKMSVLK